MRALCLSLLLIAAPAWARTSPINPGTYGPNALPVWPGESPLITDKVLITAGGAAQIGKFGDASFTPLLRLDLPFGQWAVAFIDTQPLEIWHATTRSLAAYGSTRVSGVSKGDLRFGAKFLLLDGASRLPSLALRFMTKTTTGKDEADHRFTDAPGYLIDGVFGLPYAITPAWKLELDATLGFFAWQQGSQGQNDAVQFSASATLLRELWFFTAEFRGYAGWQTNDKPMIVAARVGVPLAAWVRILAAVNVGFVDAPQLDARVAFEFRLPSFLPIPAR
jgi:hypothetical protein